VVQWFAYKWRVTSPDLSFVLELAKVTQAAVS
jgi:hypothetical protein